MKATITKCLFPAAGYGTRFLPATKSMPKEMLLGIICYHRMTHPKVAMQSMHRLIGHHNS